MAYSRLATPGATRALLDEFGLRAKYKLGQNFLVDDNVVGGIVRLADLREDEAVVEVGPGIGTLTSALLPRVSAVVAIEADDDMRGPLSVSCADYSERLALISGDCLRVHPEQVRDALAALRREPRPDGPLTAAQRAGMPHKLVSNLPYAVAAKLILAWMEGWDFLESMTVMVQAEVADRIAAAPGSKTYGAYTLKLALLANVTGRFEVPHACFFPAPHVESAVVRIDRRPQGERLAAQEARLVARVIDAAFAQRRKTLRNSLTRSGCPREVLDEALSEVGIQGTARAETLVRDDFVALARAIARRTDAWPQRS